ncbi:hypothetical protein LTR53_005265 [Teratosphaeriaceae sp. CCFEE 6253]|nr:hypothetical protein LTR53_005265 [Teratosphaeriaceae sp. CCFEE 6253]
MEALALALQSDILIKLVVGDPSEALTFHMSKLTLENTSDYFVAALRNHHLGTGQQDTLTFADDDIAAWKVLLFWIHHRHLPADADLRLVDLEGNDCLNSICIRTWALGDKYGIAELQDLVMLELIRSLEGVPASLTSIKQGFESTPPGSVLRALLGEELAEQSHEFDESQMEMLDMFDGVVGMSQVLAQMPRGQGNDSSLNIRPRIPGDAEGSLLVPGLSPYWKFMIGSRQSERHWLHGRLEATNRDYRERWIQPLAVLT